MDKIVYSSPTTIHFCMSRSTRKPYLKDSNLGAKRQASRAVRRANKRAVEAPEDAPTDGKSYRKVFNSYDISDWSFYSPDRPKASRK